MSVNNTHDGEAFTVAFIIHAQRVAFQHCKLGFTERVSNPGEDKIYCWNSASWEEFPCPLAGLSIFNNPPVVATGKTL